MDKANINSYIEAGIYPFGIIYWPYILIHFKDDNNTAPMFPISTGITIEKMEKCGCTLDDLKTKSKFFFNKDNLLCLKIKDIKFELGIAKKDLEKLLEVEFK